LHPAHARSNNRRVRNPDEWWPLEPEEPEIPQPVSRGPEPDEPPYNRRTALIGLVLVLLLVGGGFLLTHVLRGMAQFQDCVLSGRSNCS
jgi:hypothetical protein